MKFALQGRPTESKAQYSRVAGLSQEVTEITAGDAINKETRVPHVGLCSGGTSGTIL